MGYGLGLKLKITAPKQEGLKSDAIEENIHTEYFFSHTSLELQRIQKGLAFLLLMDNSYSQCAD